ncbi:MAG: transporter substrate-binding domain-containing protein [Lachnospiraceae bacterium]
MKKEIVKRSVALVLAMAMVIATLLTGCGNSAAATTATSDKVSEIISKGKITVGIMLSCVPFGYYDESGNPAGYDVEIAKALADSLGVELEIQDLSADNRIPSLETGKVDVVIGCFTRTLGRAQKIDFSDPYCAAGARILLKSDSTVASVSDLAGAKIGAVTGSVACDVAKSIPNANVQEFDTTDDALLALENDQIVTYIEDSTTQEYMAFKYPDKYKVIGDSLCAPTYNCIGVQKNNQEWLNYINLFVFTINTDGTNDALYSKYFGCSQVFDLNPQY